MQHYFLRRFVQSVGLLVLFSSLSFGLVRLAPGGPEQYFLAEDPAITPESRQTLRQLYGLDDPWPVQLGRWWWQLARLDFGRSYSSNRPVVNEIATRLPNTLQLVGLGAGLGLLGIPLGLTLARRAGSRFDQIVRFLFALGLTLPHWWLGLLLLLGSNELARATGLRLLPLPGNDRKSDEPLYRLWQLALPALLLALNGWIGYARYVRGQALEVLPQDYIRAARARGLGERQVQNNHVRPNALIPAITLFASFLPGLFGGAVIFEYIFALPGMGSLAVESLSSRDYPLIMGIVFISTVLVLFASLGCDLLYAWVDPRIRLE